MRHRRARCLCQSDVSWEYFSGKFVALAMKPWKAGEQVYINYGPQTNDSLLQVRTNGPLPPSSRPTLKRQWQHGGIPSSR